MAMSTTFLDHLAGELEGLRAAGLYKAERVITSPQGAHIAVADGRQVLNFCANNYLGLADHPELRGRRQGRARPLRLRHGLGALHLRHAGGAQGSSRRASRPSSAPRTPSSIRSCFDANGGLFETLLGEEDAIISDALNHASIIDGVRLCKAQALSLRQQRHGRPRGAARSEAQDARFRLIATDGVFSMDGIIADLDGDLRPRRAATTRW